MPAAVLLQYVAAAVSLVAACLAIAKRRAANSPYFAFLALCNALFTVGYLFEVTAPDFGAALVACRVQYLGLPFLGVLFYLFTRDYRGRPLRIWWRGAALLVFPVVALILAAAWPKATLYYQSLSFSDIGIPHLVVVPGVFYYLQIAYTAFFALLGLFGVVRHLTSQDTAGRRKAAALLALLLLPVVAETMYMFHITSFDYTSSALTVSVTVLGVYLAWFQLIEAAPAARERVLENIGDGYVFLDTAGRYLDSNAAARSYYPTLSDAKPGTPIAQIQDFPLEMLSGEDTTAEYTVGTGSEATYIRASRTAVQADGKVLGTSILLYDVTETHRLLAELNEMATQDALTGLLNRGTFFKYATRDFELAMRNHQNAAVLMMDIDFFKQVNDQYGHLVGDQVLISIADILRGRLRRTDIIGRYGGEEICVWLPGASLEGAQIIAEVIRRTIEQKTFQTKKTPFQITISIGVAPLAHDRHECVEDMIQDADTALYQAKATGRNKVVLADMAG